MQIGTELQRTAARSALRSATGERHARLDRAMPLARLTPTLDDYCNHLLLLREWQAPLEDWLASFADGPHRQSWTSTPSKSVATLIALDLAAAGCTRSLQALPKPAVLQPGMNAPYRWGTQYVIEGAKLGSAVLYSRLSASLAPHPLHYLNNNGIAPGPGWNAFLRCLEEAVTDPVAIGSACEGACDAFDQLLRLVEQPRTGGMQ